MRHAAFGHATRTPWATGSLIQAEDFDAGGDNVADYDTTGGNAGGYYRASSTDIGFNIPNDCYFVGWTRPGEWAEYSLNVPTTGTYILDASVAADATGGSSPFRSGALIRQTEFKCRIQVRSQHTNP